MFEEVRLIAMGVPTVGLRGIGRLELEAVAREEGSPRATPLLGGAPLVNCGGGVNFRISEISVKVALFWYIGGGLVDWVGGGCV